MKQNTPDIPPGLAGAGGNADKWDRYRGSFLKLIAEEARLQIITGTSSVEMAAANQDDLENAVVRFECARLAYNDCRNILAIALSRSGESFQREPVPGARGRSIARVARLLSQYRGERGGASANDARVAERIVSVANERFLEQQRT